MKILFLPGYRYPNDLNEPITSGDLRYSFTLSRAMAKLGHDVNVISRQREDDPDKSRLDGVNIFRYKSGLAKLFGTSFDISINRFKLFNKLLKDTDLIICNSALSLEHLLKIRPPIIYVASGLEDVKNYSYSPKEVMGYLAIKLLRNPLKRLTWRRSRLVNTTAWHEDKTLINWGIPKAKIGKISSSIDSARFHPQEENANKIRKKLGISNNDEVILSVSRFTPAKGVVETIRAFDKLDRQDAKLILIGVQHSHDTSYHSKILKELAGSKNKNRISLLENVPERDLPAHYSIASVTSVFSKGYDPLPTVIIESMACGAPVVATYYKTREQFIADRQTGIFIEENNLADWVEKIKELLDNSVFSKNISEKALNHVKQNFDYIEIARKYLKLIEA